MALFRCVIRGENFPGILLGQSEPVGFYTTRYVEAASGEQAETLALADLRADEGLSTIPASARTEESKVYFEEIIEVSEDTERLPNRGFTFFTMGT